MFNYSTDEEVMTHSIDRVIIIRAHFDFVICSDLALALRRKLGDWTRVAELQNSTTSTDLENKSTYNQMGNYYSDRLQYSQACRYYKLASNSEKLVDCFYAMEDYESLEKLADSLDERDALLPRIASMFTSVGLCQPAVQCYLKVRTAAGSVHRR